MAFFVGGLALCVEEFFFAFFPIVAVVTPGTCGAVIGWFAPGSFRSKIVALIVDLDGAHGFLFEVGGAPVDLSRDLDAVEQQTGAFRIDSRGRQRSEDFHERKLDSLAALKRF